MKAGVTTLVQDELDHWSKSCLEPAGELGLDKSRGMPEAVHAKLLFLGRSHDGNKHLGMLKIAADFNEQIEREEDNPDN